MATVSVGGSFFLFRSVYRDKNVITRSLYNTASLIKNISRKVPQTALVSAVLQLFHPKIICYLLLRQIVVFPQTRIIVIHGNPSYITIWC